MNLERTIDGVTSTVTLAQLRREFPSVSFPASPSAADLEPFGVRPAPGNIHPVLVVPGVTPVRVEMHKFLAAIRKFGLRVQMERFVLVSAGQARDYWFTAPYVARTSKYIADLAQAFALTDSNLDEIFASAGKEPD